KVHLELLRENIANNRFRLRKQERRTSDKKKRAKKNNREVKVTISIGYAERNEDAKTPDQVLKLADKALYRAKGQGRNCVSQ
nr:diguanylate cyclase [Desulfobacula sp.]